MLKMNPIFEEIGAFMTLEILMKGFEYNMINNIYVPSEEELAKFIDFEVYQKKLGAIITDKVKGDPSSSPLNPKRSESKNFEIQGHNADP